MSTERLQCRGTTAEGPCRSPFVGEDSFCPAHRPGGREELRERGRRGAAATARRLRGEGLGPDDLPPLRTPQDAAERLDLIQQAVGTGRLGHREGDAMTRAIRAWLDAHKAGAVAEELVELRQQVEALKRPKVVR